MGFHDVLLPIGISYGSQGGEPYSTGIVEVDSGAEEATARWSVPKRSYEARYNVTTRPVLSVLQKFWQGRLGSANTFRFMDWSDYASTSDGGTLAYTGTGGGVANRTNADQTIGTGDGATTTFQLIKKYTDGLITRTRNITKPVSGTMAVAVNGTGVVEGTNYTVNYSTGVLTFMVAPTLGHLVTAGFEFHVPCRFHESIDRTGFRWRFTDAGVIDVDSVPIVEVPDGPVIDEEFYYGGSPGDAINVTASFGVNLGLGRAQVWNVTTASLNATMPFEGTIPDGFPILGVKNSGTQSVQIKRSTGTNEFSIASGASAMFALVTQAGVKRWYGL